MPAVSTSQQALMGQAYGIKIGSIKPSDLNPKYRDQILDLAKNMTEEDLKKYASTKHKGLSHHVKEALTNSDPVDLGPVESGTIPKFSPSGPGKIVPFLDPDSKQKKKGSKNLQNLKDYRDWISNK